MDRGDAKRDDADLYIGVFIYLKKKLYIGAIGLEPQTRANVHIERGEAHRDFPHNVTNANATDRKRHVR